MIKWHTGDGLRYFVEAAVADLGLSARHVNAVTEWMINFQQRPILGGMVLAEESGDTTRGMVVSPAEQQVGADGVEQLQEVRMQLPPVDVHTVGGELRVYTRPLDCGAALDERRGGIVRYAVHDVVHTEGMTIVDRSPSSEAHAAVVICQHGNGSCDVHLLNGLELIVRRVHVRPLHITLDSDTSARVRAYASDVHLGADTYTEGGTHVSRHATSTAMVNEGAAAGSARQHDDD